MNVFRVHDDPRTAARMLPDQHVVKMQVEAAQILSTALAERGIDAQDVYRPTHRNHPCTILATNDDRAAAWVLAHGLALVAEWRWRKQDPERCAKAHGCLSRLAGYLGIDPDDPANWADAPAAMAVPDDLRHLAPVLAYRETIRRKVRAWSAANRPARWTRRIPPVWAGSVLPLIRTID